MFRVIWNSQVLLLFSINISIYPLHPSATPEPHMCSCSPHHSSPLTATPKVTFLAPAELWIPHAIPYSLPAQLGLAHTHPLHRPCSLVSILVPDSIPPCISCSEVRFFSCPYPQSPFPNPKPKSRSVLLHITSPLFYFHFYTIVPEPMPVSPDPVMLSSILIHSELRVCSSV